VAVDDRGVAMDGESFFGQDDGFAGGGLRLLGVDHKGEG
jgi:hypothetical protein